MGRIWRPQRLLTIAIAAIASLLVLTLPVTARGASCNGLSTWSRFSSGPQVNQAHVFCGEFSNIRPKGFHSRPGGRNPNTVANLQITQYPSRPGRGPSAPATGGDYWRCNNGDRFTGAGACTRRNDINTAFPLR